MRTLVLKTTLRTRYALMYLAGYLFVTGLGLGLAPRQTLAWMGSTVDYGATMPRWLGMFSIALGALVVQVDFPSKLALDVPVRFGLAGTMSTREPQAWAPVVGSPRAVARRGLRPQG